MLSIPMIILSLTTPIVENKCLAGDTHWDCEHEGSKNAAVPSRPERPDPAPKAESPSPPEPPGPPNPDPDCK